MGNKKFVEKCKEIVAQYHNAHTDGDMILPDGMYYEVTYNGVKNEAYLDAYKKQENVCVKFE